MPFPHALETPVGFVLLASGLLACFVGYRLFRLVLAIYGFIAGAALTNSLMGATGVAGVLMSIVGGVVGAAILVLAYFLGIALAGAALGALVAHVGWAYLQGGEPPLPVLLLLAVFGALGALLLQRYVIIIA